MWLSPGAMPGPYGNGVSALADVSRLASQPLLLSRDSESDTLSPLPDSLRSGLAAVSVLGTLSFVTTLVLLVHLSYRILRWLARPGPLSQKPDPAAAAAASNTATAAAAADPPAQVKPQAFLVPSVHLIQAAPAPEPSALHRFRHRLRHEPPNQFLLLIWNLLLADIQQATAFALNMDWVATDSIVVGRATCWAQGWFVSVGDLASSVFVTAIAVHTYLAIIRDYQLPTWAFNTAVGLAWVFVYLVAVLGVVIAHGRDQGPLYTRAGAWCWVNDQFQDLRLALHYLWIFIGLATTSLIYVVVFFYIQSLSRCDNQPHHRHHRSASSDGGSDPSRHARAASLGNPDRGAAANRPQSRLSVDPFGNGDSIHSSSSSSGFTHQQAFLIYPIIYVLCTAPLAAGRIATMAGTDVSNAYFCLAAAMISSNGWLDVILYASTRRSIVFGNDIGTAAAGLDTFAFLRPASGRPLGNVVVVQGGVRDAESGADHARRRVRRRGGPDRWMPGWLGGGSRVAAAIKGGKRKDNSSTEEVSLKGMPMGRGEGMTIHMDTTATVAIEDAVGKDGGSSRPASVRSSV